MYVFLRPLTIIIFIFLSFSFSEEMEQKLIVSSHINEKFTKEDLLRLKVYFVENDATRILQDESFFEFSIEAYDEYKALVISPIKNDFLRNELLVLLAPQFPDIFYVMNKKKSIRVDNLPLLNTSKSSSIVAIKKENLWFDVMGLEWLSIWILAVIGLILSIRDRRKMVRLKRVQENIKVNQKNIEKEITKLGKGNA